MFFFDVTDLSAEFLPESKEKKTEFSNFLIKFLSELN